MYIAIFWGWGFYWNQVGITLTFAEVVCLAICLWLAYFSPGTAFELGRAAGTLCHSFFSALFRSAWATYTPLGGTGVD